MDILLVDNYDSFTYNLVHQLAEVLAQHPSLQSHSDQVGFDHVWVERNDALTLDDIAQRSPGAIIISPGPSSPNESGLTLDIITTFAPQLPVYGVCLGMQAIAQAIGGPEGWTVQKTTPMHGKPDQMHLILDPHTQQPDPMFEGLPNPFRAIRYHSLCVVPPPHATSTLRITAQTQTGIPMGLVCPHMPLTWGVQFHPESIGSTHGHQLIFNFLSAAQGFHQARPSHSETQQRQALTALSSI